MVFYPFCDVLDIVGLPALPCLLVRPPAPPTPLARPFLARSPVA